MHRQVKLLVNSITTNPVRQNNFKPVGREGEKLKMVLEIAVTAWSNPCKVVRTTHILCKRSQRANLRLNSPRKHPWATSSMNPFLRILLGVVQNFTDEPHEGNRAGETCRRGGLRSVTVPTWAESDVAELGLLLGALAGVPPELGGFAGAGPVPVASPTGGRAQAPWRPLVPGAMHCKGSRRSEFSFPEEVWGSEGAHRAQLLPARNEWRVGSWRTNPPRGTSRHFYALLSTPSVCCFPLFEINQNALLADLNFSDFLSQQGIFFKQKTDLERNKTPLPLGKHHHHCFVTSFFSPSQHFLIKPSKTEPF